MTPSRDGWPCASHTSCWCIDGPDILRKAMMMQDGSKLFSTDTGLLVAVES